MPFPGHLPDELFLLMFGVGHYFKSIGGGLILSIARAD